MHTTALCSPSRSCILTGRNHHSNAHGLHHRGVHRLSRLQRRDPVRERLSLGDAAAAGLQHLRRRQVAPDAGRADQRRPGPTTAGRSAAASSATTASSAATPTSTTRSWSTTTIRSSRRSTPEEGYHLTEDLVDQAIGFIADAQAGRPGQAVLPVLRDRREPRAAPGARRSGPTSTRASSTTAGTPTARRSSRGRRSSASCPTDAVLSPHDPDVPALGRAVRRRAQAVRPHDGGVRRVPRAHRPPHRPAARLPARASAQLDNTLIMVISDNGASAEGGPHGSVNENKFFNNVPEILEDEPGRDRRAGRPEVLQPLSRGAGPGRATHRSGAGSARPTAAASAIRSWCTGPRASRPRARSATSTPTRSTWCRRCSRRSDIEPPDAIRGVTQSPIAGRQLRATPSTTRTRRASTTPSTSRCSAHRSHLPRRLAGGVPVARDRPSPRRGASFGQLDAHRGQAARARRQRLGALPRRRRTPAETNNLAGERTATSSIEMIALWYVEAGKYNVLPLDSRGTAALRRSHGRQISHAAGHLRLLSRHPDRAGQRRGQGAQPGAQHHRRGRRSARAVPRVSSSATAATPAATRSSSRTARCTTCTTTSARRNSTSASDRPVPAGKAIRSVTSSSRPASPTLRTARVHAGPGPAVHRR